MTLPLFSLQAFYGFCKAKPASEKYSYAQNCPVEQYGHSIGVSRIYDDRRYIQGPIREWEDLARGYPRTFGDLAQRIRERIAMRAH